MSSIIEHMKKRGYPYDKDGVCWGIMLMAERAYRCGEFPLFKKRMEYLHSTDVKKLPGLIRKAKMKMKAIMKKNKIKKWDDSCWQLLTEEERLLLSIDPFFFQVASYFSPAKLQSFLELRSPTFNQIDSNAIERYFYDDREEKEAPVALGEQKKFLICALEENNYSALSSFLKTFQAGGVPIGIGFTGIGHAVHLSYNHKNNEWTLTNNSKFKTFFSIKDLVQELVTIFGSKGVAYLSIFLYPGELSPEKEKLLNALQECSNHSLSEVVLSHRDHRDAKGTTPLSLAVSDGHVEAARFLVERGAYLNFLSSDANHLLFEAASEGYLEITNCLLEAGMDPNKKGEKKMTALHRAALFGHYDVALALLQKKADFNALSRENRTPLYYAAQEGYLEIVSLLLQCGAGINTVDREGWTPLHAAAERGYTDVVMLLIQSGALLDLKNNYGFTALQHAAAKEQLSVTALLLLHGASLNLEEKDLSEFYLKALHYLETNPFPANKRDQALLLAGHYFSLNAYFDAVRMYSAFLTISHEEGQMIQPDLFKIILSTFRLMLDNPGSYPGVTAEQFELIRDCLAFVPAEVEEKHLAPPSLADSQASLHSPPPLVAAPSYPSPKVSLKFSHGQQKRPLQLTPQDKVQGQSKKRKVQEFTRRKPHSSLR